MGRWFDVRAFPIGDPDSLRIAVLFNDITARVEADQEREALLERERRARAAAEAFLAVMSHELRTPVTSIYGAANLLAREGTRADAAELAQDIVAETERLQRIIDDLLVLSGVERGFLHLSPEPMLLQPCGRRGGRGCPSPSPVGDDRPRGPAPAAGVRRIRPLCARSCTTSCPTPPSTRARPDR